MKATKPKPRGIVRILARDVSSGKSKCLTVYETTAAEVIAAIRKSLLNGSRKGAKA